MGILNLRKVVSLADFYRLYTAWIECQFEEEKAKSIIAKTRTGLFRYTLPCYGLPLKLNGNLSSSEINEGLKLMEEIPIYQAVHLLEAQEQVFDKFGDRVSPASQRVYRSALLKMLTWGQSQDWWKQSCETSSDGRTPEMLLFKKRVKHCHKLKPEEISTELSQQIKSFSVYLTTARQRLLSDSSSVRYCREILGILGWMHRVKGVALVDLSLTNLMPIVSMYDQNSAEQIAALAEEYLEWMRANLGGKESTLKFALQAFFYLAEYIHYDYTNNF
jgi:hypothetical protein